MMSGEMTVTANPSAETEARMQQRAQWLRTLSSDERDELFDLPLRAVDARFEDWLCEAGGTAEHDTQ